MIKTLSTAITAVLLTFSPTCARIEGGTGDLLRLVESYGVDVQSSSTRCKPGVDGMFVHKPPAIHICHDGRPDKSDHDTVRHEVWHYLQSCVTPDGARMLRPYFDRPAYVALIDSALTRQQQARIMHSYHERFAATELEAFAAAENLTADMIAYYIRKSCTPV